jgi:ABC-type sugar transport system ATPase subunit
MLELVDLTKSYGGSKVLANLSHRFAPGEFVAVMGESGVGKSTLLNLIAGLDTPDGGQVVVDGVPMSSLDDDAATKLRRSRMGFIFQAFHVLPHLTLEQNVALPLLLNGGLDAARARAMLDAVGLRDAAPTSRASCPAASCSGWRSRARWCTAPRCCWPTSRPATSIRRPPKASCSCCAPRFARAAPAPSWSPTRTRPPPWPTAPSF